MSAPSAQATNLSPRNELPPVEGLYGMMNVFIDPATTAKKLKADYAWVWPMTTITLILVVVGFLMMPYTQQLIDARLAQAGSDANEHTRSVAVTVAQVSIFTGPLFAIGLSAFMAWLISGIVDVLGMKSRFRDMFTLVLCCGLIPMLQYMAAYIVLRAKNEQIQSVEQLRPPFGIDLFLPDLHGPALAFVSFFSIFELWYLIVLTVGVSHLVRCPKGKAFAIITPAWLLPLLLSIAGAALQH